MRKKSKRSRKSNRISWAQGDYLCQVKLFFSDDSPVKVGLNLEDDLQAKTSRMLHSDTTGSNDLPPGFERSFGSSQSVLKPSYVPQIQWKCPTKFVLSDTWQVAAGEESEEVKHQKLREMRTLEAIYPRFSAIPPSPSVSMELEREYYDDRQTPLVPLIPIEEEEFGDSPSEFAAQANTTESSQPPALYETLPQSENHLSKGSPLTETLTNSLPSLGKLPNPGVDVASTASAVLAAITTSNEKGSLIDTNLLIEIFNDPKMIQQLIANGSSTNSGTSATNTVSGFISEPRTVSSSNPLSTPTLNPTRPVLQDSMRTTLNIAPQETHPVSRFQQVVRPPVPIPVALEPSVSIPRLPGGNLYSAPNQVRSAVNAAVSVQPNAPIPVRRVKDMDYYKSLIKQHGEEKDNKDLIHAQYRHNYFYHQESKPAQNFKPVEPKTNLKPCLFFKTPRGCRKGPDCTFLHDVSWRGGQEMEDHSAKRMKLNGGINGGMLV